MRVVVGRMLVLLAVVLSFTTVQTLRAQETHIIVGTVYSTSIDESIIEVDVGDNPITTVYCIPLNHLAKKHKITLEVGDDVSIEVYDRNFSDGTTKLVAVSLTTVNDNGELVTVNLRDKR